MVKNILQREMNEMTSKAHVELNYITAWKKTQCQQSILRGNITLKRLNLAQRECIILKENERRVTEDIEAFLLQNLAVRSIHLKCTNLFYSSVSWSTLTFLTRETQG